MTRSEQEISQVKRQTKRPTNQKLASLVTNATCRFCILKEVKSNKEKLCFPNGTISKIMAANDTIQQHIMLCICRVTTASYTIKVYKLCSPEMYRPTRGKSS